MPRTDRHPLIGETGSWSPRTGDAARHGRDRRPDHGRGHVGPERPGPAALRVVAPAAPVRVPRRRSVAAARVVDRRRLRRDRRWPGSYWWTRLHHRGRQHRGFRIGLPLWRSVRHDLRVDAVVAGVTRRHVGLPARPAPRPDAACGPGSSSSGGSWARRGWTRAHPYSLSAAPRPDLLRITVKDLGDGSGAVPRSARHPRTGRGPVRAADRRGAPAAPPDVDRLRHRHHADAGAARVGALPPRRGRPDLPRAARRADFAFYREIEWLARARGVRVIYLPGPRGAPAARGCPPAPATDAHSARPDGAGHRSQRRVRLRTGSRGWSPWSHRPRARRRTRRPHPPRKFSW